jgi:arabinofuranosyltransferase
VAWAVLCASELRLPQDAMAGRWADIEDERLGYGRTTGKRNPVSLQDYGPQFEEPAAKARDLAGKGDNALILLTGDVLPLAPGSGVVLEADRLGAVAFAAGPDVTVHDLWGLSDPVSSRLTANPTGRIGHQKGGSTRVYELARRSVPAREVSALNTRAREAALARGEQAPEMSALPVPEPDMVAAARVALRCPAVRELLAAVEQPLTPVRALTNIVAAPRLTMLRLPRDPRTAPNCRGIG